jgi:hypothetical protein
LAEKVDDNLFPDKEQPNNMFDNFQADKMQAAKKSGMYWGA